MPYIVNHIHLKSKDPKLTADWFVKAFKVEIVSDRVRTFGDRFIETKAEGGMRIFISGARDGEELNPADDDAHLPSPAHLCNPAPSAPRCLAISAWKTDG